LLNQALSGSELVDLKERPLALTPTVLAAHERTIQAIYSAIKEAARSLTEERVILEGASQLLRQPEFQDIVRLEQLLSTLEQRSVLYEVFSQGLEQDEVTVIIGEETPI